jgi:hypothetical protein
MGSGEGRRTLGSLRRRFLSGIAVLAWTVAAAGCGSPGTSTCPPIDGEPTTPPLEEPLVHDCLPGFNARAAALLENLRQRNAANGPGWGLRLANVEDFRALESLCIDLSVALEGEVVLRTWRGGKEPAPPGVQATCVDLRTILAYDRWPPTGGQNHVDPANRGWLLRPPGSPAVPGADDLYRAIKEALDM